ncbi:MAG TPA: VOC family protein [Tepidisphaeraceae bacterium]|nr:VOC family protein [Tepidisphaeraceae bacterium]
MRLTHIRLCVDDVQGCYRFYKDVMKLKPQFDASESVYAEFVAGHAMLALFDRKLMDAVIHSYGGVKTSDGVVVCFDVDNVDQFADDLKKQGAKMVTEPHDEPKWMLRVAHFRDPAGNLIEINQAIDQRK